MGLFFVKKMGPLTPIRSCGELCMAIVQKWCRIRAVALGWRESADDNLLQIINDLPPLGAFTSSNYTWPELLGTLGQLPPRLAAWG